MMAERNFQLIFVQLLTNDALRHAFVNGDDSILNNTLLDESGRARLVALREEARPGFEFQSKLIADRLRRKALEHTPFLLRFLGRETWGNCWKAHKETHLESFRSTIGEVEDFIRSIGHSLPNASACGPLNDVCEIELARLKVSSTTTLRVPLERIAADNNDFSTAYLLAARPIVPCEVRHGVSSDSDFDGLLDPLVAPGLFVAYRMWGNEEIALTPVSRTHLSIVSICDGTITGAEMAVRLFGSTRTERTDEIVMRAIGGLVAAGVILPLNSPAPIATALSEHPNG